MARKPVKKSTRKVQSLKARKLTADSAKRVKGGLGDIKGESLDEKHKDWL